MDKETKTEFCPLCHEEHESMSLYGVRYIGCPMMPKDVIMSKETIEVFFQERCVLGQPVIT